MEYAPPAPSPLGKSGTTDLSALLPRSGRRLNSRLSSTVNGAIRAWVSRPFSSRTSCAVSLTAHCSLCQRILRLLTAHDQLSTGQNNREHESGFCGHKKTL